MPTRSEIQQKITEQRAGAQDVIRKEYLAALAKLTGRDTILYASAFSSMKGPEIPGIALSVAHEDLQGFMATLNGLNSDQLDLILHSPGGSMEAADQIVQYLRAKYSHIRAIVPQNAMSAATMIACACDEIVMGKHSAIGPIDPQVTFPTANGAFTAPAQAILDEFEQAKREIADDPKVAPLWMTKIQAYPHGFLTLCDTTLSLAREKVAEWLAANMFRDVVDASGKARAIADWLGNAKIHKTHGRPITLAQAAGQGLKVFALEGDQELQEAVLSVYHATMITFETTACVKMAENHKGKGVYLSVQVKSP